MWHFCDKRGAEYLFVGVLPDPVEAHHPWPESVTIALAVMKRSIAGALSICLAATLWGLDGVVLTPRLFRLSVPFVVFLLHLIPFVLMQPVLFKTYGKIRSLTISDWLALTLVALCGGILGTYAIVKALFLVEFNQLSVVVLLQKLQPLFAIILAGVLLGERITRRFVGWASIAVVGAYLLTFGLGLPEIGSGSNTVQGAAWAAVAAAAFGSATVFGKRLLQALDFKQATFARYGLTTALALIFLTVRGEGLPFSSVTPSEWLLVLIIGLTTGSGAIFLYYFGLSRVPATVSAICELCLPLSAIVFDYLVNGSVLGAWQWVGVAVLLLAIFKVSGQPQQSPERASSQT